MGGSAFSSLPNAPYTPRMPPEVYRRMVAATHTALREMFICVATPIEAPGKTDYGDIDILVALEKRAVFPKSPEDQLQRGAHELMAAVKRLLGAEHAIIHPNGASANLAIPWPSDMAESAQTAGDGVPGLGSDAACEVGGIHDQGAQRTKYIQVDVRICPDVDELCWILYKHAHGDIWNLIGSTIRPFGLTVDEEALWLRIPEIEQFDRKAAKVCLSRDPVEILHFLGMKVEGFWAEPFKSVEELFAYATTCRLFCIQDTPDGDAEGGTDDAGVMGGTQGRKKLKSNDRRRMNGRPIFRRWINEFIPKLRAEGKYVLSGPGTSVEEIRARVREDALAHFVVEVEYKNRRREWLLKREREQMKSLIKDWVPSTMDHQFRSCLISALRKIVMEDDRSFEIAPSGLRNAEGFYNVDLVRDFVRGNWERVGEVAWAKQQEKAREAMRLKASSRNLERGPGGQMAREMEVDKE